MGNYWIFTAALYSYVILPQAIDLLTIGVDLGQFILYHKGKLVNCSCVMNFYKIRMIFHYMFLYSVYSILLWTINMPKSRFFTQPCYVE